MNRRQFIALSSATLASRQLRAAPTTEIVAAASPLQVDELSIEAALQRLDQLQSGQVTTRGRWNLFQVYTHLAQSVEFSMTGYPQQKSWLFKNTVGSLAFVVFAGKGSMNHSLDEVIPGAPLLEPEGDAQQALERLRQSLQAFQSYSGELQPHFAYGALSRQEYELAHVMHLNNHLEEFVQSG